MFCWSAVQLLNYVITFISRFSRLYMNLILFSIARMDKLSEPLLAADCRISQLCFLLIHSEKFHVSSRLDWFSLNFCGYIWRQSLRQELLLPAVLSTSWKIILWCFPWLDVVLIVRTDRLQTHLPQLLLNIEFYFIFNKHLISIIYKLKVCMFAYLLFLDHRLASTGMQFQKFILQKKISQPRRHTFTTWPTETSEYKGIS